MTVDNQEIAKPKSKLSLGLENNFLLHIIEAGIFIILFLPIFVNRNFLFPFIFPKTIAFRLIIEIILALYLVLIIVDARWRPRWSVSLGLLTTFIGIMVVSSLGGVDWHRSFWSSIERGEGILTWLHLLAFFIILNGIYKTKKDWLKLFKIVIIAGWIQSIYVFGQAFEWSFALKTYGARIGGSIGNASFLASYLIFIIFIAAYLYSQSSSLKARLAYFAIILIDIFLVWRTETRGAILALILGFLLILIFNIVLSRKKLLKAAAVIILLVLIGTIALVYINKDDPFVQAQPTLNRLANISLTDITAQNRFIVWGTGWQAFLERPLLGWGWENFNAAFNQNFNPAIARDVGSQPWYDRAHNVIVEVAVATGILGLLAYLAIFAWSIKLLWQKIKTSNQFFNSSLILIVLLIVYLFQNIFVFDTLNSYLLFFLILAFIQFETSAKARGLEPSEISAAKLKTLKTKASLLTLAFLIAFAPLVYFFNLRPTLANYYTIAAVSKNSTSPESMLEAFQKSFSYSPPNERELRFILVQHTRDQINARGINSETIPLTEFAISEMKKSIQASPQYIQDYLILVELYVAARDLNPDYLNQAEALALEALAKAPKRYQVYTSLGRLYMAPGKYEQGIEYFKQATTLNDKFAEAHWNLAMAYILSRQPDNAQAALDQALERGFNVYAEQNIAKILNAFQDAGDLKATIDFLESLTERFGDQLKYQQQLDLLKQIEQTLKTSQPSID